MIMLYSRSLVIEIKVIRKNVENKTIRQMKVETGENKWNENLSHLWSFQNKD